MRRPGGGGDPDGPWPPIGHSPDLLGIDERGRLLVIEAKPSSALSGIVWGAVQLRFYAELWAELWRRQDGIEDVEREMLDQRVTLGLSRRVGTLAANPVIVPVLAIGAGSMSAVALSRMREVSATLPPSSGRPDGVLEAGWPGPGRASDVGGVSMASTAFTIEARKAAITEGDDGPTARIGASRRAVRARRADVPVLPAG